MPREATAYRVVRDPIYGYVRIPSRLYPAVDTPIVQRLRRVAQTSLTSAVYPSATGSRFEHALGTMFLAGRAWDAAWGNASVLARGNFQKRLTEEVPLIRTALDDDQASFEEEVRWAVMGVGLLHDLGHPPFSHVLESVYEDHAAQILDGHDREALLDQLNHRQGQFHESAGEYLLRTFVLPDLKPLTRELLRAAYLSDPYGDSAVSTLHSIVSGELDVDRLDYLMRDSQRAGTEFGAIDWERLVDAYRLRDNGTSRPRILPALRARSAAESLLVQRVQAYRWIIYHYYVIGANLALSEALRMLLILTQDNEAHQVGEKIIALADIFQPCLRNINYLDPGQSSVAAAAGRAQANDASSAVLYGPILGDLGEREIVCAATDDSSVARSLLDARMLAASLSRDVGAECAHRLQLFVSLVEAALLRRKNFIAVWTSEGEFAASAEEIWSARPLQQIVERALEAASTPKELATADPEPFRRLSTPGKVNALLLSCTSTPTQRAQLEQVLSRELGQQNAAAGKWRVTPVKFAATAQGDKAGRLWDSNGTPFILSERSQLVKALEEVDQQRPKVGMYYFIADAAAARNSDLRETLRPLALDAAVRAVTSHLLTHVPSAFLPPSVTQTDS